jgi:hypothetical protein
MANTAAQFGFRPIGNLAGGAPDHQLSTAAIQSSYATKIFFGDPVVYSSGASPYIVPATGTGTLSAIMGIFQGCEYTPSTGGPPIWTPWWPASQNSDAVAYIIPNSPGNTVKFLAASLLTAVGSTVIGRNIGYSTGAGGTTTGAGLSTFTVDQSTIASSSPFLGAFKIIGLYQGVGNGSDPTTNFNWVVVSFNPLCTAAIQ